MRFKGEMFLFWSAEQVGRCGRRYCELFWANDGLRVNSCRNLMKTMSTLEEINLKARAILARELGPVDYVRFFRQYEPGRGDYTRERQQRPAEGVETIHRRVVARRRSRSTATS